jgi:hypothetical protein
MVQMKNKIAVLLMESGVSYNKQKLHKVGCFRELLATNQEIDKPYFGDKRDEKPALYKDLVGAVGIEPSGPLGTRKLFNLRNARIATIARIA